VIGADQEPPTMTTEPLSASAAVVGRTYTNSKGVRVTITGLNPAGDKVIVRTEAGRTVDLDLTYPLYAIAEEAPAGAVTVASLVGRPRDAITPHLSALTDAELEQLGNLDTRMWLGHAIMEEIDRRGKAASEAQAAPVVEAAPTPPAPPLSAPLPFPVRTPPPWEPTADQVPESLAARVAAEINAGGQDVARVVDAGTVEITPIVFRSTAAPVEKPKRTRKPKAEPAPVVAPPIEELERVERLARLRAAGAAAFHAREGMPESLTAEGKGAWREGFEAAQREHEEAEEVRITAATDDDVFGWLDEAIDHVTNGTGSSERVQELVDDALEARESLRAHLRPVLDLLEAPLSGRNQTLWDDVEGQLRGALRELSASADLGGCSIEFDEEAAAPDLSPTVADFPDAHAAGTVAAKAGAPNEPPAYDSPVARAAWTAGWLAWRGPAAPEVEPATVAPVDQVPAAFLTSREAFAARYLREHGSPELADDAETLDTIRGLTANVREQMSALAGCYNGTVIAAALAWERANDNRDSLVRKLEERASRIADGSARPRKVSAKPAAIAPASAPVPTSDAEISDRPAAADPSVAIQAPLAVGVADGLLLRDHAHDQVPPAALRAPPYASAPSTGPALSDEGRKRALAIRARLEALREAVPALIAAEEALAALRELGVTVDLGVHLSASPTVAR
jgi:hypothetical protein